MSNTYKYSEIFFFFSIQGEAEFTGAPTIWIRWFMCNLQCEGFGQTKPEDPSTHILPYKEFDASQVNRLQDLPVWEYSCDSSYSWAKKFKHLQEEGTAEDIANQLENELRNEHNPDGYFTRHKLHQPNPDSDLHSIESEINFHLCMTGGEPMLKKTQDAQIDLLQELERRNNLPKYITIETNGTQKLTTELSQLIDKYKTSDIDWFWSISPKLLYTSGEKPIKAIKPDMVREYKSISDHGQLKFVVSNRQVAWDELERVVDEFRVNGVDWPVWIMPVGATVESQESDDTRAVVEETLRRGYNVSARVHAYIWGNSIGS